jgi:hypothetical protein
MSIQKLINNYSQYESIKTPECNTVNRVCVLIGGELGIEDKYFDYPCMDSLTKIDDTEYLKELKTLDENHSGNVFRKDMPYKHINDYKYIIGKIKSMDKLLLDYTLFTKFDPKSNNSLGYISYFYDKKNVHMCYSRYSNIIITYDIIKNCLAHTHFLNIYRLKILYRLDYEFVDKLNFLPFNNKFKAELTFTDVDDSKNGNFINKYDSETNIFDFIQLNIFPKEINNIIHSYINYTYIIYSKYKSPDFVRPDVNLDEFKSMYVIKSTKNQYEFELLNQSYFDKGR